MVLFGALSKGGVAVVTVDPDGEGLLVSADKAAIEEPVSA